MKPVLTSFTSPRKMEKVFTYGTLQDQATQKKLFGHILVGKPDTLIDYECRMGVVEIEGEKYNTLVAKPGGRVDGIVYELSNTELQAADQYEGKNYKRIKVSLLSGIESWIYVQS